VAPKPTGPVAPSTMDPGKRKRLADARIELDNLDRQIQGKVAEESRLQGMVGMYQARLQATPLREAEITALTRDYQILQESYRSLLQKKEESQMSANLEKRQIGEQFKILDPARMPEKPVSPNRPLLYSVTTASALLVGLLLAGLLEYRDTTFKTDTDVVATLTLPVLAMIPELMNPLGRRRALRRRLNIWGAVAGTMVLIGAAVVWALRR